MQSKQVMLTKRKPKVLLLDPDAGKECAETIAAYLKEEGIDCDVFTFPREIRGCVYCGKCFRSGRCMIHDEVNEILSQMSAYDGIIMLARVYYGDVSEQCRNLAERLFRCDPAAFSYKPAATVILKRKNTGHVHETMNAFYSSAGMYVYTGQNENACSLDEGSFERSLKETVCGYAYLVKCITAAKEAGLEPPDEKPSRSTAFLR